MALPTTPTNYSDFQGAAENTALISRTIAGVVLLSELGTPVPDALTNADGEIMPFPEGWWGAGVLTDAGYSHSSETDSISAPALGHAEDPREDDIKMDRQLTFTTYEHQGRRIREAVFGMDLSEVEMDAATGEVRYKHPRVAARRYLQVLTISVDEVNGGPRFDAVFYPEARVTGQPEDANTKQDYKSWEITMKARYSKPWKTARMDILTGPGYLALADVLGYKLGAGGITPPVDGEPTIPLV